MSQSRKIEDKVVVATRRTIPTANNAPKTTVAATLVVNKQAVTKADVQKAWDEYKGATEKHGVELGKLLFAYRDAHKSKGGFGSGGQGLVQLLDELDIPHSTAYWSIERYEISVRLKPPRTNHLAPVPSVFSDPKPEPEPEAEREPWSRAKERRKGRFDPALTDDAEILRLALKIVNAGYRALMAADDHDGEFRTHLWRAQREAKDMIRAGFAVRKSSSPHLQDTKDKTPYGESAA